MQITTTKTTTTATTVTLKTILTDDGGKQFATITGTVDSFRPLGTASLSVTNRALYTANKDAAAEAYQAFQTAISALDAATESVAEDVELLPTTETKED